MSKKGVSGDSALIFLGILLAVFVAGEFIKAIPGGEPNATATPMPSFLPSPSISPSLSPSPAISPTPTPILSPSPSISPSFTPTPKPILSPSPIPNPLSYVGNISLIYLWEPSVYIMKGQLSNPASTQIYFLINYKLFNQDTGLILRDRTFGDIQNAPLSLLAGETRLFDIIDFNNRISLRGISSLRIETNLLDGLSGNIIGSDTRVIPVPK